METWFLLFAGTSTDGTGQPDFVGRTTDKAKARKHYEACRKSPYDTGKVMYVTERRFDLVTWDTNWDAL